MHSECAAGTAGLRPLARGVRRVTRANDGSRWTLSSLEDDGITLDDGDVEIDSLDELAVTALDGLPGFLDADDGDLLSDDAA